MNGEDEEEEEEEKEEEKEEEDDIEGYIYLKYYKFRALHSPPSSSCRGLWGPSGP